jgi:hypothetical protein
MSEQKQTTHKQIQTSSNFYNSHINLKVVKLFYKSFVTTQVTMLTLLLCLNIMPAQVHEVAWICASSPSQIPTLTKQDASTAI